MISTIKLLLNAQPALRNDGDALVKEFWHLSLDLNKLNYMSGMDFLAKLESKEIIGPAKILRVMRVVQTMYPKLRGENYELHNESFHEGTDESSEMAHGDRESGDDGGEDDKE